MKLDSRDDRRRYRNVGARYDEDIERQTPPVKVKPSTVPVLHC